MVVLVHAILIRRFGVLTRLIPFLVRNGLVLGYGRYIVDEEDKVLISTYLVKHLELSCCCKIFTELL